MAVFEWGVLLATAAVIGTTVALSGLGLDPGDSRVQALPLWTVLIAVVELLHVQVWRSVQVSIGVPLLMAVAFYYSPQIAGLVGFLASSDPRELRREVTVSRALFNRAQVALSVFFASLTFHGLGGTPLSWLGALRGAPAAVLVDFVVNTTLVSLLASLMFRIPVRAVRRKLRIGNAHEFVFSYVGLGLLGVLLARLFEEVGFWAIGGFVLPLLLARQMFFRTRALEEATQELRDREVVLRALSNRMAEERHDERQQIAGYLHDDLAQLLYRMSLHLDIAEQRLRRGQVQELDDELDALRSARDAAQEMVRALIRDLHRSPLGRAGLVQTLASYFLDVERDTGVPIKANLEDIDMPPPVQLLCYHVTREAVMNAVKHGRPSAVEVSLEAASDGARVTIRDDGKGFDPDEGSPEGHFGLKMMKERALVAGGTFKIDSAPGAGTTVIAEFPTSWLAEAPALRGAAPDGQP
ncbi:MAG TPA: sensor histidine kinase [Actinomycetota bacterium]|nr:sensor histidine kinase [Actinomycetota bacterium]